MLVLRSHGSSALRHGCTFVAAVLLLAAAMLLAACGGSSTPSAPIPVRDTSVCGSRTVAQTHYSHVVWIWMENESPQSVVGSSKAPFATALARSCGLATNYHNITHPSLPNYVSATSGLGLSSLDQFGSDCDPSAKCSTSAPSIFSQVSSWKAYEDSMPSNCVRDDAGRYTVRHNPPVYFTTLSGCSQSDVPYTELAGDLAHNSLPAFSFITPNLCHDAHDCSITTGDKWLQGELPAIFDSAAYRAGTVVVFLSWDEGAGGTSNDCASNTTDVGCRVANVVVSPSTRPGTRSPVLFNHYSMLRTTEQLLGLPPLGDAKTASSMLSAFNL